LSFKNPQIKQRVWDEDVQGFILLPLDSSRGLKDVLKYPVKTGAIVKWFVQSLSFALGFNPRI
jgi:hypothetical protein